MSRWGLGIFLFTTVSTTALGPTQPPIHWVPGAPSLGVKRSGREADHSPPSSAEVKRGALLPLLQYVFMAWCLVKHRDNFTFTFITPWGVLGERRYSSTHSWSWHQVEVSSQLHDPGRFTPRKRDPGTHCIGGWVGPRACLDTVVKRKIPSPRWKSKSRSSSPWTVNYECQYVKYYTDLSVSQVTLI
jgi:hypothetical protein